MSEAPPLTQRPTWYVAPTVEPEAKVSDRCELVNNRARRLLGVGSVEAGPAANTPGPRAAVRRPRTTRRGNPPSGARERPWGQCRTACLRAVHKLRDVPSQSKTGHADLAVATSDRVKPLRRPDRSRAEGFRTHLLRLCRQVSEEAGPAHLVVVPRGRGALRQVKEPALRGARASRLSRANKIPHWWPVSSPGRWRSRRGGFPLASRAAKARSAERSETPARARRGGSVARPGLVVRRA